MKNRGKLVLLISIIAILLIIGFVLTKFNITGNAVLTEYQLGDLQYPNVHEYDEIDMARLYGKWVNVENPNYVSLGFVDKYDVTKVTNTLQYEITSTNDPNYAVKRNPVRVGYRWRGLHAALPDKKNEFTFAYRVFLEMPYPLKQGKKYSIKVVNIGLPSSNFEFTPNDKIINDNIYVNQVGYTTKSEKYAYFGEYMGTLGAMPFSNLTDFKVLNVNKVPVFSGKTTLTKVNNPETGHNIYELNFSSLKTPGLYTIYVPNLGTSYEFRIGDDVYNEVFSTLFKGAYHMRSSYDLTEPYTMFTHNASHYKDAYVLNVNPIPAWFKGHLDNTKWANNNYKMYSTSLTGQFINTTRGHYDAGDYGKYIYNGALFAAYILSGYEAFSERLMRDDLNVPYSGNGIPDLLEEAKWELDWIENMQDPNDGGVFCIVKPDGAIEYYELREVSDPRNLYRVLYPKDTMCTGAYAAVMAKAARNPLFQRYYPQDVARYTLKAEKAWTFLEQNPGYSGWHHYGTADEFIASDRSADERVWASVELFALTGKSKYKTYFEANHRPEYALWSWVPLYTSSGHATLACAFMNNNVGISSTMKQRCKTAVIAAGDQHVRDSKKRGYRISMSDDPLNVKRTDWFFPQERAFQLVMANALEPKPEYVQTAMYNWDYVLGANPIGYSFISGIGSKRFREIVHTQSDFDNIEPPVSGIPVGITFSNSNLWGYGSKVSESSPIKDNYPLLSYQYDVYNIGSEFTVPDVAQGLVAAAYLTKNRTGVNIPPSIIDISCTNLEGYAPLSVKFNVNAVDDNSVVRWNWYFDDGTYSNQRSPTHVFRTPGKQYNVILTVKDNDGAEYFTKYIVVKTLINYTFQQNETPMNNTIIQFKFNNDYKDNSGVYQFSVTNNTRLDNSNLVWMRNPSGKAIRFSKIEDTATVSIPKSVILPAGENTFEFEGKIYVKNYLAKNKYRVELLELYQDWNRLVGYEEDAYNGGQVRARSPAQESNILSNLDALTYLPKDQWHHIKFITDNTGIKLFIDGVKVKESGINPEFYNNNNPIQIRIGGFEGWIDDIRLNGKAPLILINNTNTTNPINNTNTTIPVNNTNQNSTFNSTGNENPSSNTLIQFTFNNDYRDTTGTYQFSVLNRTTLDNSNLGWMSIPSGKAIRFYDITDTASVNIPKEILFPNNRSVIALQGNIYVNSYKAYNKYRVALFELYQDWNRLVGFEEDAYAGRQTRVRTPAQEMNLLNNAEVSQYLQTNRWNYVVLMVNNTRNIVYINGVKVKETNNYQNFESSPYPVKILLGGFDGWIDDVRINRY